MIHWHYLAWGAAAACFLFAPAACTPAAAQDTAAAYPAVKDAENAADRAEYHCKRKQADKCVAEARVTVDLMEQAIAILDPAPPTDPDHDEHPIPEFTPLTVDDIVPIVSTFDLASYVRQVPVPGSAAPDVVGAFRFICNVSHLAYDDPIAYPEQPGKSHLHMFFGNTGTNAASDYASLRTAGGSTCQGDILNRSAYWLPALLSKPAGGQVVVPDYISNYYKRLPASDPECTRAPHKGCVGIPVGLRAIFGTNYVQGHLQSPHVSFDCNAGFSDPTLAGVAERCRATSHIYARIEAPDCWNGRNLDSANHQDHLAYMSRDANSGRYHCPASHPYLIPQLSLIFAYAILPGDTPGTWIFSSDAMAGKPAGSTFHADYMEAWEPAIRDRWEGNCIDNLLNCSAADFGDGTQGKPPAGFTFEQRPHLIPIPD